MTFTCCIEQIHVYPFISMNINMNTIVNYVPDLISDKFYSVYIGEYTTILDFNVLDYYVLLRTYKKLRKCLPNIKFDKKLHFIATYAKYTKRSPNKNDISIYILHKFSSKKTHSHTYKTILIISCNHEHIDGTLLFNVLKKWEILYTKMFHRKTQSTTHKDVSVSVSVSKYHLLYSPIKSRFMKKYTPYLPISPDLFSDIKSKYEFTDYVIITSIWSHFFYTCNNKKLFGHLINFRPSGCEYECGNFIFLQIIELGNTILDTCEILTNAISNARKSHLQHKFQGIQSILYNANINTVLNCNMVFNNWTVYKHLHFEESKLNGVYNNAETTNLYNFTDANYIIIHNGMYCLSSNVKNITNADFHQYLHG